MRVQSFKRYDSTFREEALALLQRSDRSLLAVAADLGIPANTLRYWYNADMAKKGKRPTGRPEKAPVPRDETPEQRIARLERENAALRKKVDELEMDRAILKKAAALKDPHESSLACQLSGYRKLEGPSAAARLGV